MALTMRLGYAMILLFCLAPGAIAQVGDDRPVSRDRVLDLLLHSDIATSPYFVKITLRYSDPDTQLVILTYPSYPVRPEGRAEVISYEITGMGNKNLSQFVYDMASKDPNVTNEEIAAKLKVKVSRSPIEYKELDRFLEQLKAIRISPSLVSRVSLDEYSMYEFRYDTGQERVHYKLDGPFRNAPQDQLVQWMIRFRNSLPKLIKSSSVLRPWATTPTT